MKDIIYLATGVLLGTFLARESAKRRGTERTGDTFTDLRKNLQSFLRKAWPGASQEEIDAGVEDTLNGPDVYLNAAAKRGEVCYVWRNGKRLEGISDGRGHCRIITRRGRTFGRRTQRAQLGFNGAINKGFDSFKEI